MKNTSTEFCWGPRNRETELYRSFTFDGIEYFLHDCVYMWREGQPHPDIGKLVRIWETESHEKRVEVVWFFRPSEIANWLGDIRPLQRELFLACGDGIGVSDSNPLETISGKCNVVCSSKHRRNPQPTEEELRLADYIFSRTFDVEKYEISETLPSSICGISVDYFFNRRRSTNLEPKAHPKVRIDRPVSVTKNDVPARIEKGYNKPSTSTGRQMNNSTKNISHAGDGLKRSAPHPSASRSDISHVKKRRRLICSDEEDSEDDTLPPSIVSTKQKRIITKDSKDDALPPSIVSTQQKRIITKDSKEDAVPPSIVSTQQKRIITKDSCRKNQDLSIQDSLGKKERNFAEKESGDKQHVNRVISNKYIEVTRRPRMDSSKWLKVEVWSEENITESNEKGNLIVLENLDPSFTSAEVEDMIWTVFEQKINAKMVQHTAFSSPYSGQALAIFKTKAAADNVISELSRKCLMLGDRRPIVGRRKVPLNSVPSGGFCGHLSMDRARLQQRQTEDRRNAVATSHFSQGNTIEFDMALEWRLLQERSVLWWKALYEGQGREIKALLKQMKISPKE